MARGRVQSEFTVEYNKSHRIIFLKDTGQGKKTITNDADEVYAYYKQIDPLIRIVYQGTDDVWMEIVQRETWMGKGIGFEPWHGLTWDALKRDYSE